MILKKSQAQAVYEAMCALNKVANCGGINISFVGSIGSDTERIDIVETDIDMIRVSYRGGLTDGYREHHAGQAAFAAYYNLK